MELWAPAVRPFGRGGLGARRCVGRVSDEWHVVKRLLGNYHQVVKLG